MLGPIHLRTVAPAIVAIGLILSTGCAAGGPLAGSAAPSGGPVTPRGSSTPDRTSPSPPSRPAPPAPSTGAARATGAPIPITAMMQASDIGAGYATVDDRRMVTNDHGSLGMLLAYCGQYDYGPGPEAVLADRVRAASAGDEDRAVFQMVERYGRADARRYLTGLRRVLPRCETLRIQNDPREHSTLTIVGEAQYGDDSLLIRHDRRRFDGGREVEYLAVVRQGEVVTTVRIHIAATEARAREIVRRLADRLCAATSAC